MAIETPNGLKTYRGIKGAAYASAQRCGNPLCRVSFPQTGLQIEPRRYCSPECRQKTSLMVRVADLLADLPDSEALKVLKALRSRKREAV
jgi:hypothetical protein